MRRSALLAIPAALVIVTGGAALLRARRPACVDLTGRHALVFRHARVFDGTNVVPEADVLVVDGSIASVGELGCIRAEGAASFDEVDARGDTLLPGLIDAHAHGSDREESLSQAIAFGVTTELDMGGSRPARLAELRARDAPQLADAIGAGTYVTAPGGHGTEYGGPPVRTLARAEDADAFVAARATEGSAFIKLIISSGMPKLDAAEARAVVAAAHARGLQVVTHVNTRGDAEVAVDAGVDGLAHLFIDRKNGKLWDGTPVGWDRLAVQRLVEEIARRRIFVIPTLQMMKEACGIAPARSLLNDPHFAPRLGEGAKKELGAEGWGSDSDRNCYAHVVESVSLLRGATPLLAGTDAGNEGVVHGASLHRELELLVEAGLSPLEALRAATSAPAAAFPQLRDRGRIAPGARADLLLVGGDPTSDVLATRAIVGVYKRGVRAP